LRRGFGLITALMILVLVALLLGVVAKVAFMSVKHTGDSYMIQRAELFMQSSIENALLAIEGYKRDNSNRCLKDIHFVSDDKRFEADVSVLRYYCYDLNDCPCDNAVKVDSSSSHGWVVLKVVVKSNLSNLRNNNKRINLEKITLQRP
jgi:hypothetical protein